jgi:uncharacterized protein YjiS (DUF1127 family)
VKFFTIFSRWPTGSCGPREQRYHAALANSLSLIAYGREFPDMRPIYKRRDYSAAVHTQAHNPEGRGGPFPSSPVCSIVGIGVLPAHQKAPGRETLPLAIERASQERTRQRPAEILSAWRARRHFRKELRRLLAAGPHMIADIGLTLEQTREEIARPFWQAWFR